MMNLTIAPSIDTAWMFSTPYVPLVASALLLFVTWRATSPPAINVPAVRGTGFLGFIIDGFRALRLQPQWIREGYEKFGTRIFKTPHLGNWVVIVSNPEQLDEMRMAAHDVLSFRDAINEAFYVEEQLPSWLILAPNHASLLRGRLTRSLPEFYPAVREEIQYAFEAVVGANADDWISIHAFPSILQIVARTSNRIFMGLPFCRDAQLMGTFLRLASDIVKFTKLMEFTPRFLRWPASWLLVSHRATLGALSAQLKPLIEERRTQLESNTSELPNDFITWALETSKGPYATTEFIMNRVLRTNFAAIHTTSITFGHALYQLVAEQEKYLAPLRDEAERAIELHGWSKLGLERMRKLDSFLRETLRLYGVSSISLQRKALQAFTFKDGTHIPVGTTMWAPAECIHRDLKVYDRATEFDGFRWVIDSPEDVIGDELSGNGITSTSLDYIVFGHGKHACPGRFWAASEMKAMMAHLIINYDIGPGPDWVSPNASPPPQNFGVSLVPDPTKHIMIRRRKK